jgi:hypothetical protein|tara:strand:- start:1510 stop:1806 length:297 start_codon:yes stop_codon:yes gene_type:complete
MKQEKISTLLKALYHDTIKLESANATYNNFYKMCLDGDKVTMDYLHDVINMSSDERLELRTRIAERGFELTPNQLDQYIFILVLAIYDYTSDCHDEYT